MSVTTTVEARAGHGIRVQVFDAGGSTLTARYESASAALARAGQVWTNPQPVLVLLDDSSAAPTGARCRCGWLEDAECIHDACESLDAHRSTHIED